MRLLLSLAGVTAVVLGLSTVTQLKLAVAEKFGYLGPKGTYSEQATKVYQSTMPGFEQAVPYSTIAAITTAIKSGEVPRGLIPVENSDSGFVAETYRLIFQELDPGWRVIDEVTIPITSSLLVKPGTQAGDIKKIISHPNALRGVATYLQQHFPNIPLVEANSTAAAAKEVSNGDGTAAAVAAPGAAKVYGLETLANNIQDNDYKTNFWIIVKTTQATFTTNPNHLIIALLAPSGSRIFSRIVAELRDTGFHVVNVNSTPLDGNIHSYCYLIRVKSDSNIPNALKQVNAVLKAAQREGGQALLIGAYRR
ncbi:prephenate dehydratase [Scytonema sp. UIC 10036]|uniref:prephenate dehydratase domain-containing protein n=1 Tax=Scytonema sp. UIC 10036 TaxID=2304196 RepID=UPI0012DA8942|nr:prephenate dehydratase domain-containing protein [Scytonema sp. UIC 10036]MUG96718.1 prephenate dehydratase [Scytonema sp. UIC 10036]